MSSNDPDRIRADIERTRATLSYDVDALGDKVNPGSVAHRQATRLRAGATSLRSTVMGTARDATEKVKGTAEDVSSSAGDAVTGLPHTVARHTEGNPMAAGLIAFGVGWLASSLVPATKPEQRAALAVKEQAADLTEEAKATASEVAQHLKAPAQEAGQAVKDAATQAAGELKDHGSQAVSDLKDETLEARDNVQESRRQSF